MNTAQGGAYPTPEQARWREKLQRQYEAAVRRNRCIPDSWSLAPRRKETR